MTTQKALKRRIRTRMAKTGEHYTAARRQLLAKRPAVPSATSPAPTTTARDNSAVYTTSDDAVRTATGRGYEEWFAILDVWGGTRHTHSETTAWLASTHDVPGWWRQSITVSYQRARGMRGLHQMADGFSIGASKTLPAGLEAALALVVDEGSRRRWLADAPMTPRPTRAKNTAMFDWAEPVSRVTFLAVAKGPDKATLFVTHDRLPTAEDGRILKAFWRERLAALAAGLRG